MAVRVEYARKHAKIWFEIKKAKRDEKRNKENNLRDYLMRSI